jgi:hypothetical protein
MDYINLIKNFDFENFKLQFSYYYDGMQEPDLTIQALETNAELFLQNPDNLQQVKLYVKSKYLKELSCEEQGL